MATVTATDAIGTETASIGRRAVRMAWLQVTVILTALLMLSVLRGIDPDYWWHLRTGDLIVHHGIPRHDPFSWTAAGRSWVAHEWLSEALIYLLQSALGYMGTAFLFGAAICGTVLLMYAEARREGAGGRTLVLLLMVSTATMMNFVAVRPQVLTWLLFALFVVLLRRDEAGERMPLWCLPPLMSIWANLHLGFVYGLLAISAWCAARVYARAGGNQRRLLPPLVVTAACFAAVAANPAGLALYAYPLRYFSDRESLAIIAEWARPSPFSPLEWPYFIGALLIGMTLVSKERPRPFLALLAAAVLIISAQAVRNMPFVALLLPLVVGPAMARRWPAARREGDARTTVRLPVAAAILALTVVLTVVVFLGNGHRFSVRTANESAMPSGGAAYVRDHYPGARLYNDYNWGGYLVYKLYPDVPVFIDGRTDFYRSKIIDDYTTIGKVESGWNFLVDEYGIDVMLLRPDSHLAHTLRGYQGWREVYAGSDSSVFVRD